MYRATHSPFCRGHSPQARRSARIYVAGQSPSFAGLAYDLSWLANPTVDSRRHPLFLRDDDLDGLIGLPLFWPQSYFDPHCRQASQQETGTEIPSIDPSIDRSSCTGDTQRLQRLSQILITPVQANHVPLEHQVSLYLKIQLCLGFRRPGLLSASVRYRSSSFAHTLILPFPVSICSTQLESILTHPDLHNPTLIFNLVEISDA